MASLASIRHSSENWFVWQKVQELAGSRPINAAWIGLKKDAHGKRCRIIVDYPATRTNVHKSYHTHCLSPEETWLPCEFGQEFNNA